jgi:hypothetical protein
MEQFIPFKLKNYTANKKKKLLDLRLPTEWEKIFASYTSDKGLVSRIYRERKKFNPQRTNTPMKKWAHKLNRNFSKEVIKMFNFPDYKISCKSKLCLRFHLTLVRMAIFKGKNSKCWQGCGETGILIHCWWECKLVQSLWKATWRFLKKLKIELPYDSVIPLLGTYPKEH